LSFKSLVNNLCVKVNVGNKLFNSYNKNKWNEYYVRRLFKRVCTCHWQVYKHSWPALASGSSTPRRTWYTQWRSWLRCCTTSRKVADLIPTLWIWTDPAANIHKYKGFLLWDKGNRVVCLTKFPPSYIDCLEILGASNSWIPKGLPRPVQR
jgi:hypothetical protein